MTNQNILTVTLNPAIDLACSVPDFTAGKVNRVTEHRLDAAGKGVNIAGLLRGFDLPVTVTGFLGEENAAIFERRFRNQEITDRFVRVPGETRIGIKVLDPNNESTTDINFPGLQPDPEHMSKLMDMIKRLSGDFSFVVLAGSLPAGVAPEIMRELVEIVKEQGSKAVVDTSGPALKSAVEAGPWLVKPNDEELAELVGVPMDRQDRIITEARNLLANGIHTVTVSLGAQGAVFIENDEALLVRPPGIDPVSTVGAGDAMIGGLVAGMALGMNLQERVRMATALSAATVAQAAPSLKDPAAARLLEPNVEVNKITI